jgi:hypothetical protein
MVSLAGAAAISAAQHRVLLVLPSSLSMAKIAGGQYR